MNPDEPAEYINTGRESIFSIFVVVASCSPPSIVHDRSVEMEIID